MGIFEEYQFTVRFQSSSLVHLEISLALQLNDAVRCCCRQVGIAQCLCHVDRVGCQKIIQLVIFPRVVLRQEVIKFPDLSINEGASVFSQPSDLLLCLSDVTSQVQLELHSRDGGTVSDDISDNHIFPVHERDLLDERKAGCVCLVNKYHSNVCDRLGPNAAFFECLGFSSEEGSFGPPLMAATTICFVSTAVCRGTTGLIAFLFVAHEMVQSIIRALRPGPCFNINLRSAGTVSPRRRIPRTVGIRGSSQPVTSPVSTTLVSFFLFLEKEKCLNKVDVGKVPHLHRPELQGLQGPLILRISISVLSCAESMGKVSMLSTTGQARS